MSRTYFDLSALAAAAQANDCTVHLYQEADGRNVFSVGNSNTGAREFASFDAAMKFVTGSKFTEADCAEQAGVAIAGGCLDAMLAANDQTERANLLAAALVDLATLKHHEHAVAGFAGALVATLERRRHKTECEEQIDSDAMLDDTGRMLSGLMLRQKRIRYARNEDVCPICGGSTVFLNIGDNHYETCPDCKKYLHYGENLHSGWRTESPEVWQQNESLLKGYTEFDAPPAPPAIDADDASIPF